MAVEDLRVLVLMVLVLKVTLVLAGELLLPVGLLVARVPGQTIMVVLVALVQGQTVLMEFSARHSLRLIRVVQVELAGLV